MFRFFSVAVYLKIIRSGSSESVNNQGELIGPQSDLKWPARPLYLHFPLFYSICTIYIFNKVKFIFPSNTIIIFQPSAFQDFSRIFHGMEELCYISKRFLCPDKTFVLQRDIEYWKSLTTSKGAGTYKDSKAFQINPHYFYVEIFVNQESLENYRIFVRFSKSPILWWVYPVRNR